jgi:hypothetical protein
LDFGKARPSHGQGVTFAVNRLLIVLLVGNKAKTLTFRQESGPAAPRFGHRLACMWAGTIENAALALIHAAPHA